MADQPDGIRIDRFSEEERRRSTVDVSIDPEAMLRIRDEHRQTLVRRYHLLLISARQNRKTGDLATAHRLEEEARRTVLMVWCLDNPMEMLTFANDGPWTHSP